MARAGKVGVREGVATGWPVRRLSNPSHVAARGLPRMGPRGTDMGQRRRCGGFVDCVSGGEVREEEEEEASKETLAACRRRRGRISPRLRKISASHGL